MSGTKPSRPTDLRSRLIPAVVLAAAFAAFIAWGRHAPALGWRPNIILSVAIGLVLACGLVVSLVPLRRLGHRLLIVTAAGVVAAILFTRLDILALADVGKVVAAATFGIWLAAQIESLAVIVLIAGLIVLIDIYSVFAGPTKVLLTHHVAVVNSLTVAFTWLGYDYREWGYSALGASDLIFYGLFVTAATVFGLRVRLTATLMALSFLLTVALAVGASDVSWLHWAQALPALPLLSVAFVAANADLLRRALWGRSGGTGRA